MLNSFWSCSWSLITETNIIYFKALAKQEEPKQLLGCPKNRCRFLNCRLPDLDEEITVQCVPSKTKVTDFWSINNPFGPSWFVRALTGGKGGKYLFFVSSRSVKFRGFSFLSLYKSVFIFQFFNDKIHSYVLFAIIVHFNILLYKLRKLNPLILTEREETKSRYFQPLALF